MSLGDRVLLAHGGGGSLSGALIREVFVEAFANPALLPLGDSAVLELPGSRLAFTTDGYVVSPPFFPGGDIGTLAVAGTVNDLAVSGARPRFLSCSFILEEGFPLPDLRRVVASMAATAQEAGVSLVAGDTKVVERGSADGIFISTSGMGELRELPAGWGMPGPGDCVLINGTIGDHGFAVLAAREGLDFQTPLRSDCAPLNGLIDALFDAGLALRFLRDATRGGVAAILNELASGHEWGIALQGAALPFSPAARSLGEILGIDPLYAANEGKVVVVVDGAGAGRALQVMRSHPLGREAALIGALESGLDGLVVVETGLGARRILDMPLGEQLPRIC
ncbi:MAG: hydrogenase expression/formation protein HypE [Thermoleophilia bacterium]|nr:hydrogenase expression/formation protein HypE [Thermoleophilia bacterium]